MTTATRVLVEWATSLTARDVPDRVRTTASRHVMDGVGCAIAGARRADSIGVATTFVDCAGPSTILGLGTQASPDAAAFANGFLMHVLDYDDTHSAGLIHATSLVVPTTLAAGEVVGAAGDDALTWVIAGYEVATRIAAAVPHGFHRRGFHASGVVGVFAAALVDGLARGDSPATIVNALGIAGSLAAGSLEFLHTGSETKSLHPGLSARAGLTASRLARAGASGPSSILEGEYGLYRAYADRTVDTADVTSGLGSRWESEQITIKPYPLCQLSHASLDAFRDAAAGVPATEIESIQVVVPTAAVPVVLEPHADKTRPRTAYEAKFSLPWDLAVLAVDGHIDHDSLDRLDRPEVRRLAERVSYATDDGAMPVADHPGKVRVTTSAGAILEGWTPMSLGGPANPMDEASLMAKFVGNCASAPGAEDLGRRWLALDHEIDVGALMADSNISRAVRDSER